MATVRNEAGSNPMERLDVDEDLSVNGLLQGIKAPGAVGPV